VYSSSSKQILEELPRGAYTTARTFNKCAVFELDTHVTRMAQTCRLLAESDQSLPPELADSEKLSPLVQQCMAASILGFETHFRDGVSSSEDEFKLTLVATWESIAQDACSQPSSDPDKQNYDIYCHCQSLDYKPKLKVKLEIRGSPRENALAKDTNWTGARKPLEQLMSSDCDEIILADSEGNISEGTQTNFYAIDAETGDLITACEGVLEGTVRRVLIQVCATDGVRVRYEAPSIEQARAGGWAGCAVSSTSRLFLPVDMVMLPQEGLTVIESGGDQSCRVFEMGDADGPYVDRCAYLADRVRQEVASRSTQLPGLVALDSTL